MKISTDGDRIVFEPENIRESFDIGRLSKIVGNTTTLIGDSDVKISMDYREIFELVRQYEELKI
jgi:hypothetical protein